MSATPVSAAKTGATAGAKVRTRMMTTMTTTTTRKKMTMMIMTMAIEEGIKLVAVERNLRHADS